MNPLTWDGLQCISGAVFCTCREDWLSISNLWASFLASVWLLLLPAWVMILQAAWNRSPFQMKSATEKAKKLLPNSSHISPEREKEWEWAKDRPLTRPLYHGNLHLTVELTSNICKFDRMRGNESLSLMNHEKNGLKWPRCLFVLRRESKRREEDKRLKGEGGGLGGLVCCRLHRS